jgi:hypothetical protein
MRHCAHHSGIFGMIELLSTKLSKDGVQDGTGIAGSTWG